MGEAEVELCRMSKAGNVDLILTEDSDALLFGARKIARESVIADTLVKILTALVHIADVGWMTGNANRTCCYTVLIVLRATPSSGSFQKTLSSLPFCLVGTTQ
jgi:hypothetical protein